MVKSRLVPILLLKDGRMIKTKQFDTYRDVGNPLTVAKVYDAQKADELVFLDITATVEGRHFLLDIITDVSDHCFIPLTVGGGIKTAEQVQEILAAGADKIAVNSAAVERPEFIDELSDRFGKSTVVVSIDFKKNKAGENEVFIHRGQTPTGLDPIVWAKEVQRRGAGEILLTSIDRDGMMNGYDLAMIQAVADGVSIPVVASGGVGSLEDFVLGINQGHASAVAAGSIFHFTDQSVIKAHAYMRDHGLNVRM